MASIGVCLLLRRRSIQGAGLLVALLAAGLVLPAGPAHAQTAEAPVDIVPRAMAQNGPQIAQAQPSPSGGGTDGTRPSLDTGENIGDIDIVQTPQDAPLGGIGDEAATIVLEPEVVNPDDDIVGGFGINLISDDRLRDRPPLHSALQPEPHDLDPYLPVGIRIGSFILFPEIETGLIATNNVLGTQTNPHADAAFDLASTWRLQSNWSRHSLTFLAETDDSWYANFPGQDDRIYDFLLRGRLDVTRRTHVGGELEAAQTQVGRTSASLTDIAGNQTNLFTQNATVSADHVFNRLSLKASQTFADYDYDDVTNAFFDDEAGVPVQDVRDYTEAVTTLRGTYEFNSAWAGFVEGSVNNREYQEPINVAGFRRGSDGYIVAMGANIRFWGTVFGEFSVGWGEQQPIDDRLATIEGPLVNADLIWMMTPLTKVELIARSTIDETTLDDSAGAIDRFVSLSLQHVFWRYFVAGPFVSYENATYAGVEQVDQRTKAGLTGEYYFNPLVSMFGRYTHTAFVSTFEDSNFEEDQIRMGVKFRR